MKHVKGKRVLITGGAGGIGLCTAEEFAKAGANLVLTDLDAEGLEAAKTKLQSYGVQVDIRAMDVSSKKQVKDMADWVINDLGGLDILINNAGVGHNGELVDTTLKQWEKLISVNLQGVLYHVYAFLPYFKKHKKGHIVNVSSGQAFFRLPTWGAYASIKAALGAFSEILFFEVRKYGIKVTTVYPFMVNTPFYKGVDGDTWGAKMSMKLLPYYSMTPEKVGKIIFKAVRKNAKVEMVSILNDVGFYAQFIPGANDIIARASNFLLAKRADAA